MAARRLGLLILLAFAAGCQQDTLLGFAIGDIGGLWTASAVEYRRTTDLSDRVDIVQRDGASMILSVDDSAQPPTVGATLDDGLGDVSTFSGTVDIRVGVLTLGSATYTIDDDGEAMTLTDESGVFDFGAGPEAATVVIRLDRI